MLKNDFRWLTYSEGLQTELSQSRSEGRNVDAYENAVRDVLRIGQEDPERERQAASILDKMNRLPFVDEKDHCEPSDLVGIRALRPQKGRWAGPERRKYDGEYVFDRIYGSWLGRTVGCLLGQPVEGWLRRKICGFLADTGNSPLSYYMSSSVSETIRNVYGIQDAGKVYGSNTINWINNVSLAPIDDDTNYTILALKLVEDRGVDFTPHDVAENWLMNLPILQTCTAERVAYKNFVEGILPPNSATHRNPYREWVGAQIRGDLFGLITPGRPDIGADLAWRDASVSHVKNGIYGEMFMAAMVSAAAVTGDINEVIEEGLAQIPERCRLAQHIRTAIRWWQEKRTHIEAIDAIHSIFDENNEFDWVHTIPNALIVCTSLLYGKKKLERTLEIALTAGFDTDCNCASAGSLLGVIVGASALPEKWTKPLNDQIRSGVLGFSLVPISELARRTERLVLPY